MPREWTQRSGSDWYRVALLSSPFSDALAECSRRGSARHGPRRLEAPDGRAASALPCEGNDPGRRGRGGPPRGRPRVPDRPGHARRGTRPGLARAARRSTPSGRRGAGRTAPRRLRGTGGAPKQGQAAPISASPAAPRWRRLLKKPRETEEAGDGDRRGTAVRAGSRKGTPWTPVPATAGNVDFEGG